MSQVGALLKWFGLDWLIVNERKEWGSNIVVIAPYDDGTVPREELLARHIPFAFLFMVKLLYLGTPVVIRGLITQDEVAGDHAHYADMNAWQALAG